MSRIVPPSSGPRRRDLLAGGTAFAALAAAPAVSAQERVTAPSGRVLEKYVPESSSFPYEVQRSKAEWMELLGGDADAYGVLRKGNTEWPKTTDLWKAAHDGEYACVGCDLPVYDGSWFVPLTKGWVFFEHSIPNTVMLGVDGPVRQYGMAQMGEDRVTLIEVHCRRCGSHLGHYLPVDGQHLHCINGTSLNTV